MSTLLYVDDEVIIGRAVARWFERRGHAVHVARSVGEAKRALNERDFDAIFVDVWLGTESGFELMAWIDEHRPQIGERVTFVTGDLLDGEDRSATRVWATLGRPVLRKPFDFAQLEAHARFAAPAEQATGT